MLKRRLSAIFMVCLFFAMAICSQANSDNMLAITVSGSVADAWCFTDGTRHSKCELTGKTTLNIKADEKIAAIYFVWDAPAPQKILIEGENLSQASENGFIHDYIKLNAPADSISVTFEGEVVLCDIYAFSQGELPDWVQQWETPKGECDVLFLPTHADDEMLYFGGAMAQAANRKDCEIQVAYMVNHNGEYYRPHELLNGLWELGVRRYPIIPQFPDIYSWSLEHAKTIYDQDEILSYQIDLICEFRPHIIIGHDLNGEYGHGAHILNAVTLTEAVKKAAEPNLPNAWNTPKLYLHLYDKNAITIDSDLPLERFEGATAFEMAQRGFACHRSQQSFFTVEASGLYDMRKFGLYRSAVGSDTSNDIFENIVLHSEIRAAKAAEEAEKAALEEKKAKEAENMAKAEQKQKEAFLPTAENDTMIAFIGSKWAAALIIAVPIILIAFAIIFNKRR